MPPLFLRVCPELNTPAIVFRPTIDSRDMNTKLQRLVSVTAVACAAVVISATPGLAGQMPQGTGHAAMAQAKPQAGMPADMAARCQAMMAGQEKMMAETKAADARLDDLVVKMNAASGMEKASATAAVVSELVLQRRTMRDGMMKMQHGMMGHMMEHAQAGKDSMAMCPMMKQMGGVKH